jgi:ATP-dependent RNA helicase SUPV3L1/SUV3
LGGAGRGLVFQLAEALGLVGTAEVAVAVATLDPPDRTALGRLGVRFGTETVFFEPLLRPEPVRLRALLWAVRHGAAVPALPPARRLAKPIDIDPGLPLSFWAAIGFRVLGGLALRADHLERLAAAARKRARRGPFAAVAALSAAAGIERAVLPPLLDGLGYRRVDAEMGLFAAPAGRRRRAARHNRPQPPAREGNPFAKLRELRFA